MANFKFDYSKHTLNELYECLESIDDKQYPKRALEIYLRLLKNLQLENQYPSSVELGYQEETFWEYVTGFFTSFSSGLLLADEDLLKTEMRDKIDRLNQLKRESPTFSP